MLTMPKYNTSIERLFSLFLSFTLCYKCYVLPTAFHFFTFFMLLVVEALFLVGEITTIKNNVALLFFFLISTNYRSNAIEHLRTLIFYSLQPSYYLTYYNPLSVLFSVIKYFFFLSVFSVCLYP